MQKYKYNIWIGGKNLIEFTEEKSEQISNVIISRITVTPYKGPAGKDIDNKENFKDLRVIINEKLEFGITFKKL